MTDDEITDIALGAVNNALEKCTGNDCYGRVMSALMLVSYNLLRTIEGDEFVAGFLESSLDDINSTSPCVELRTVQ